jgi:hypothetical protein
VGWTQNIPDTLTLPPGASSSTPRRVIGPDIPTELATWSADFTMLVVDIWYYGATSAGYYFEALATYTGLGGPYSVKITGVYDGTDVNALYFTTGAVGSFEQILYGSDVYNNTFITFTYRNSRVQLSDTSALFLGSGAGKQVTASNEMRVGVPGALLTTNSATFVNLAVPAAFSFVKQYPNASTKLLATITGSCFFTSTNTGADFGVNVNDGSINTDTLVATLGATVPVSLHSAICGMADVTGFDAGTLTITPRWRRNGAVSTINMDARDRICIRIEEVHV